MRRVQEYTNLAKARVFYDGKGAYTFNFDKGHKLPNPYVFRGEHDSFVRFLMGIKAKDNKTWPRSVRGERYSDIADEIESGSDQIIYVWEHDFMRYINRKESISLNEASYSSNNIISFIEYVHKVGTVGKDWMHWEYGKFHITPIEDAYEIKAVNSVFDINPELYKIKRNLGVMVTVEGKEGNFTIYNEDLKYIALKGDFLMVQTKNDSTFELWAN